MSVEALVEAAPQPVSAPPAAEPNPFVPDGAPRVAPWLVDSLVLGVGVALALALLGSLAWPVIRGAASSLTILIFEAMPWIATPRGYVAEALSVALASCLGALPPAIAMGCSEWRPRDRFASSAALYPVWLAVVLAPAGVLYQFGSALESGLHPAQLAAEFAALFSAAATGVALAFTVWARHHPDAVRRNEILPKTPSRRLGPPRGRNDMMMAEAA